MERFFEKISFDQFKIDCSDDLNLYNNYQLPKRSTEYSAGYDFYSLNDIILKPGESQKIPTGVKANMGNDEVLLLVIRSSMGFKYNIRMCNQIGVIDKDYYGNSKNEGHIWIKLQNEGKESFEIKTGDAICQGIFTKFLVTDNENKVTNKRIGGIGSTNK